MPTSIAQNENDQVTADAYRAAIQTDALKLWGCVNAPANTEAIAFAGISGLTDPQVSSGNTPTLGAVRAVNVAGTGDTFGFDVSNFNLTNNASTSKSIAAVILVNVTKSKALYLLKFDSPIVIPAGGSTVVNLTLYFNTAPYS